MTIGSTGSSEVSLARQLARAALAVDLGRFDAGCHRQGKDLPAGFSLLRLRGAAIIRGAVRRSASHAGSRDGATIIGTSTLASPGDAAFANASMGHGLVREDMHAASICHHGVVIWPTLLALSERTPLSGATLLAAAIIGYETGAQIGRALLHRRPRAALPADRPGRAARRSAGGKLCARPCRGCRDQRHRHCRQHIVGPERMAACRRLRDVFPSRLCRPQRDRRDRTGGSRRLRLGNDPRRRSRTVRRLPAASPRPPTSVVCRRRAGNHGRLQQAGSRLQFRANRRAGRVARRARTRELGRHRDRFDPRARSGGPLSRLRLQGTIPNALQAKMSIPFSVAAVLARGALEEENYAEIDDTGDPAPRRTDRSAKRARSSPPHSRPARAPRFSLGCATARPSGSASTMSLPPRRRKSAPAFDRLLPASSAARATGPGRACGRLRVAPGQPRHRRPVPA